jgi:DNA-binding transcriptional ArsR family regulator
VDDAKTLKALSDPLRLSILTVLMDRTSGRAVALTVKDLADRLAESQTKLYRHVKLLQDVGLVQVAETRVISGNVEHRYRTGQLSLRIDDGFLSGAAPIDDALDTLDALWSRHHDALFAALRAERGRTGGPGSTARIKPSLIALNGAIPLGRAQEFTERLRALAEEFSAVESDPHGVVTNIVIAYYASGESED